MVPDPAARAVPLASGLRRPGFAIPSRAGALLELTKPRITLYVLLTAATGFAAASGGAGSDPSTGGLSGDLPGLLVLLLGTALIAGGTNALNQLLERDADARMLRTRNRPLPSGRLSPREALAFAIGISVAGSGILAVTVNPLTAAIAVATLAAYILVYTPLKIRSPLSTPVGAVPGALPIVGGWTAASAALEPGALALFAILFVWQMPHFLGLGWLLREDYRRGGFRVLGVADPSGRRTARRSLLWLLLLVPASHLPLATGVAAGPLYVWGSLGLGAGFLAVGVAFARRPSRSGARRLFLASILYLPAILALLVLPRA